MGLVLLERDEEDLKGSKCWTKLQKRRNDQKHRYNVTLYESTEEM